MNFITIIGIVAPVLSIVSFMPQVIKCWQTKRTKDISFPAYLMFESGAILWTTYGFLKGDLSLIVTNSFLAFFVFLILLMKLKFE